MGRERSVYFRGVNGEGKRREGGRVVVFPLRKIEKEKKDLLRLIEFFMGGMGMPIIYLPAGRPTVPPISLFSCSAPPPLL